MMLAALGIFLVCFDPTCHAVRVQWVQTASTFSTPPRICQGTAPAAVTCTNYPQSVCGAADQVACIHGLEVTWAYRCSTVIQAPADVYVTVPAALETDWNEPVCPPTP